MFDLGTSNICETCGSPFHQSRDCDEKALPRFKSRKKLGLKPGEIPFKFTVDIDPENDEGVEVARKQALLRVNSSKIYAQMGCAVKAHEASVETSQWLARMLTHCEEQDKIQLASIMEVLTLVQGRLLRLREVKIAQSAQMEEMLTKAARQARKVRTVVAKKKSTKLKKFTEFSIVKLPPPIGAMPPISQEVADFFSVFEDINSTNKMNF